MTIIIDNQKIKVGANASTLILYEDRFKGRRLLRDASELLAMADTTDVPFGLVARILWAEVKTADADAPDFYEWIKGYSIGDIVEARIDVLTLLAESIQTVKKQKAAAIRERIWRRLTFWRMRRNAD